MGGELTMPKIEVTVEAVEPIDRLGGLLERGSELAPSPAYPGLAIRAGYLESA